MTSFPLRASALKTFQECPQKAYYTYIEKVEQPTHPAAAMGTATHATAAWMLEHIKEGKGLPSLHETENRAYNESKAMLSDPAVDFRSSPEDRGSFIDRVVALSMGYRSYVAPYIKPLEIEATFETKVPTDAGELTLTGTIDIVAEDGIHETKTTRISPPLEGESDHWLQVGFYSWARPHAGQATLDYLCWSERKGRASEANAFMPERSRTVKHLPVVLSEPVLREEARLALEVATYTYQEAQAGRFRKHTTACFKYHRRCPFFDRCRPQRTSQYVLNPLM
jgi:hypothetical protein